MTWGKVDDKLHSHPKADAAGLEAMGLWVLALSYCVDQLTDGVVSEERVTRLVADRKTGQRLAARLVEAGFWTKIDGGFRFHDWETYQPRAESVKAERDRKKRNVAEFRARRSQKVTAPVTGYIAGKSPACNRVPDPEPDPKEEDLAKADPPPPLSQQGRPTTATEPSGGGGMNPAIAAIRETLATSLRLRHLAGSELPARIASHCREHGHMGRHSLADVVRSVTEADAKLADLAAAGEDVPNARIVSLVVGCVKAGPKPEPKSAQTATTTRRAPWLPPVQPMTPSTARVLSGPIDESAIDDDASPFAATPPRRAV